MHSLLSTASRLAFELGSLGRAEPADDLIVLHLVRLLDGRYELTAAGASLRAGLRETIDGAPSMDLVEEGLETLFSHLEALGAGLDIPGAESLQLEHMALCRRVGAVDSLTRTGEWLRDRFRAATMPADQPTIRFEFSCQPELALSA